MKSLRTSVFAISLVLPWSGVYAQQTTKPERRTQGTQAAPKIKVTGLYSNMHYVAEAGDVLGMEIFIVYAGDSDFYALMQCAEGWPSKPVLVAATVEGSRIELKPHESQGAHCPTLPFVGTVSKTGLSGRFDGTGARIDLPRRSSFWQ